VRFAFDEDHLALRDAVRTLLAKECTPADIRASWDTETGRSPARWTALAEMGVVGLLVPEGHGGMGMDEIALVGVLEESAKAGLPEPLAAVAAVAAPLLADVAPAEFCNQWLPRIAGGEAIAILGLAGTTYVDDAHVADVLLMTDGSTLHAVDPGAVTMTPQPMLDRSRRRFRVDWRPNAGNCIAFSAAPSLAAAADRSALAAAAGALGIARKLLAMATEYATVREQFGVPIGTFQAVKHQLADVAVAVEFAAPAVYRAAWSVATEHSDRHRHVTMAESMARRAAHHAARTALQVHGAIGYTDEHDLHLWLRRGLNPAAAMAKEL
jgi:alkylation response protein AidB-like acyl-CoA dehydrogenase